MVTPMELAHTTVDVTLSDYYAAEYIDKLDELKTNIDERQACLSSMLVLSSSSLSMYSAA